MKKIILSVAMAVMTACSNKEPMSVKGGDEAITFIGRTDFSDADAPKQWAAGAYFTFGFEGERCIVEMNDEDNNIMEIVVDDLPSQKVYTKGAKCRFVIGGDEIENDSTYTTFQFEMGKSSAHHVLICRDAETAMGFTQLVGVTAEKIFKWTPETSLKIEFIGNSITCGAEADTTSVSRTDYHWGDWHRAYVGYAPRTARNLNAQWSLVSVSGIGLIRSCCDMGVTMPQVYDKMILRYDKLSYDFSYNPDLICCCLGQNDGIQDSTAFCSAYIDFIKDVHQRTPQAKIVLLSSPMDHGELNEWLCRMLTTIADQLKNDGIDNISTFFYSKAWNNGGAMHPSTEEHIEIANELTAYLKTIL